MIQHHNNKLLGNKLLHVDIVLATEWWNKHEGISFNHDFFIQYVELKMNRKWEKYQ